MAAYAAAVLTTPAGISGAVWLLPFQVSVLDTPSLAATPTNLLYNVVATPGALYRYWRQQQTGGRLALVLIAGTLPGVIAGAVIRVELLPGPRLFDLVIAAVSLPLGAWLALTRPAPPGDPERQARPVPVPVLVALAAAVGCVGGIYGIGGGALLAPILIGLGRRPSEVAPAALAATFVTSVVGVLSFTILSAHRAGRGGTGLAHRHRAWARRPGRWLYRCPSPVPAARRDDPPPGGRCHPGYRHLLPVVGLGLILLSRHLPIAAGPVGVAAGATAGAADRMRRDRQEAPLTRWPRLGQPGTRKLAARRPGTHVRLSL